MKVWVALESGAYEFTGNVAVFSNEKAARAFEKAHGYVDIEEYEVLDAAPEPVIRYEWSQHVGPPRPGVTPTEPREIKAEWWPLFEKNIPPAETTVVSTSMEWLWKGVVYVKAVGADRKATRKAFEEAVARVKAEQAK